MSKSFKTKMVMIVTCFVASTGCNKVAPTSLERLIHKTPGEAITRMLMACNAGKYTEVEGYFPSSAKTHINGPNGAGMGGIQKVCNQATRNGTLDRVEVLKVEVRGEGARVYVRMHYKDGSTMEDNDDLIKENGEWKVTD